MRLNEAKCKIKRRHEMRIPKILRLSMRLLIFVVFAGAMLMIDNSETAAQEAMPLDSVHEASKLIESRQNDPDFVILDVRTPSEFAAGHIAGARLLNFNAPDFADKIKELPRDKTYLVYCRSGNRSAKAVKLMQANGFSDLINMDGGMLDWEKAGLPVTKGE